MLGEYRITGRGAAEISASVERAVGSGELEPGQPLPPMRELAQRLGVNPNTVAAAYRTLRERGVIETAGRRGSRVRAKPATTGREFIRVDVPAGVRDVSDGNPDPALLPALGPVFAVAAAQGDREPVLYGHAPVDPELARVARAELDADGVPGGPVMVTSGSLDAMERVLAAHLRPGDAVAVEDPGWGSLLDLVPALGLRTVPVGVDDQGPLPEDVRRVLAAGARALVVTDRAQNPTGAAVGAVRARALRSVLREHPGTLLIEDDHGHGIVDLPLHPSPVRPVTGHSSVPRPRPAVPTCGSPCSPGTPSRSTGCTGGSGWAPAGSAASPSGPWPGCGPTARWTPVRWRGCTGDAGTGSSAPSRNTGSPGTAAAA